MTSAQVAERKNLYRMIRSLPSEKTDRVVRFIRMISNEPDDDSIYDDMDPDEEDALYQSLALMEGVWDDA